MKLYTIAFTIMERTQETVYFVLIHCTSPGERRGVTPAGTARVRRLRKVVFFSEAEAVPAESIPPERTRTEVTANTYSKLKLVRSLYILLHNLYKLKIHIKNGSVHQISMSGTILGYSRASYFLASFIY